MYRISFPKLFRIGLFTVFGAFGSLSCSELQVKLDDIVKQLEEFKALVPKKEVVPNIITSTNYFIFFTSFVNLLNRVKFINFDAVIEQNLFKFINLVRDFEICIQIFCLILLLVSILSIPIEPLIFFPLKFLNYFNLSFVPKLIYKNIISIFFLIPIFFKATSIELIQKLTDFFGVGSVNNLPLVMDLTTSILFILFIRYFIVDLVDEFAKRISSIKSLNIFFDIIFTLKILKILILFFISFIEIADFSIIKRDLNNVDLLLMFFVLSIMLFKIKNIFSTNSIRFDIVLKELLIPFISLLFSYYVFEKHDSVFIYRSIAVFFVWPLIYRLYSMFYRVFYSYLLNLTTVYRKSNRDVIRIFLIITNLISYLLVPLAIIIMMYIFGVDVTRDLRIFFGQKTILRFIGGSIVLFIARIIFIFSRYILSYYAEMHSFGKDKQRIETFVLCVRYLFIIVLSIVTSASLLIIFNYDIAPIFQMVSYLFIALTITAQKLVRDVINGIFMLWENTVKIDDWIEYNGKTAVVEVMSLRYMRIRFDDGVLVTIPFHKIDVIKNKTRQNSFIIFNISFSIETDVDLADIAVMEAFANLKNKDEFQHRIVKIEQRDMADMTSFSYIMQYRVCVALKWQNKVRRAFNRELRLVFLKYGISIATPLVANVNSVPSLTTGMPYPDSA